MNLSSRLSLAIAEGSDRREATEKEFGQAVAAAKWPAPRRMHTKRSMDAEYSDRGTFVASKHQVLTRDKVSSETYMVNPAYLKAKAEAREPDPEFVGGYWMVVVNMDAPSYMGGPKVFPRAMGSDEGFGSVTAGTREDAEKVFEKASKSWRGRGGSSDELNLVRFGRPVLIPKSGWSGTLKDFLAKFGGKISSGVGSALREPSRSIGRR
jgi:hypothetical protein